MVLYWLRATSSERLRQVDACVSQAALSSAYCSSGAKRIRREWVYSVSWWMSSWFINTGTLCSKASVPMCMVMSVEQVQGQNDSDVQLVDSSIVSCVSRMLRVVGALGIQITCQ